MIIQTLLIPGCSFFNTIPSIHLHMLLRNNPPLMAMIMSAIFAILYLASVLFMIGVCAPSPGSVPGGLRRAQCWQGNDGGPKKGVSKAIWDCMAVFQLFSVVGYIVHGVMAAKVRSVQRARRARGEVEAVDPDEEERRKQRARELWARNYRMEGL